MMSIALVVVVVVMATLLFIQRTYLSCMDVGEATVVVGDGIPGSSAFSFELI